MYLPPRKSRKVSLNVCPFIITLIRAPQQQHGPGAARGRLLSLSSKHPAARQPRAEHRHLAGQSRGSAGLMTSQVTEQWEPTPTQTSRASEGKRCFLHVCTRHRNNPPADKRAARSFTPSWKPGAPRILCRGNVEVLRTQLTTWSW